VNDDGAGHRDPGWGLRVKAVPAPSRSMLRRFYLYEHFAWSTSLSWAETD
jgi:hypothetical protein